MSTLHESKLLPHTQTLVKQGHLLSIAALEKSDAVWKSYMFDLKKGTMKFLLNACLDTLPTKTNLLQWGKTTSDLCKLFKMQTRTFRGAERRPPIIYITSANVKVIPETNILNAHTRKAEKYSHFIPDITSANVKVIPFKIGSRGYISPDNKTSLKLF